MTSKKEKDDSAQVQFVASKREDGKFFSLEVTCEEGLTDEEYGECLMAFANDIFQGQFDFDDASSVTTSMN